VKISVIGCGYVGLVTGACLANLGNKVKLVEIDENKVEYVKRKESPLYEKGLSEILREVDIEATSDYQQIVDSDIIFICVGTPSKADGSITLEYVTGSLNQLISVLKNRKSYFLIAVKSTVVPGTTEEVVIPILEKSGKRAGHDFGVCMTPEFLREGKGVYDFMNPDRIIIGEYDSKSGDTLYTLYESFDAPIVRVDLKTAEMIKYASNSFLATKVSFINEIGNICKQLDIDTYQVANAIGLDKRIGSKFLEAGIGFGGPCLTKDVKALIARAEQLGYVPNILKQIVNFNDSQAFRMIEILKKYMLLKDSSIGVLGLSYRPDTDDVRDSRAITIVDVLLKEGAVVKVYDPQAMHNFKKLFPHVEYTTAEEVLNCDAILIVTEWEEFELLDYRGKLVIDGRRILKAREAMIYEGVCW